ncbi:MAG TPA: hypothetical protein VK439_05200 [Rubrivivax sp.]|nr:hypothetical protein [Rubrivivax sp.]
MNPNGQRPRATAEPPPHPSEGPTTLATALGSAAADLQQWPVPAELRARVLAAAEAAAPRQAQARRAPPIPTPRRSGWAWSGAAACAVVLAGSALLMLGGPDRPDADAVRMGGLGGDFLALVPPERWPSEGAPAWLVSTELPSERLAVMGLPYDPAHAGDSVRAELLLHPSGEVLAVRFLH